MKVPAIALVSALRLAVISFVSLGFSLPSAAEAQPKRGSVLRGKAASTVSSKRKSRAGKRTPARFKRAAGYALPLKADDLKAGERYFTGNHAPGIQGEGEDMGAMRYLGNNKWSAIKAGGSHKNNADYVTYNKPIYSIADGTVVGCWRNAPENPKPPAHAKKFTDGFIPGGGNMLFVDLADGTRVLYAHMVPGTIPKKLCPNNAKYFPESKTIPEGDAYVMLDKKDQVSVRKGQFLGRLGNSGSSSGPHLHWHAEKSGKAARIKFGQGRYKPYKKDKTDIGGGWKSFAGKEIPDGEVLLRPPRENLYRMKDLEVFKVGNQVTYAGVFEPGSRAPMALFKGSWKSFLAGWQAIEKKGYRMKDLEVYKAGGKVTYAGIFEPGSYGPMALFKTNWKSFLSGWQAIEKKGYRMKDLEVYKVGKKVTYAGIFEPGSYGPMALFKGSWKSFLSGWRAIEKKGYRMKDLEVYKVGKKVTYAGVFAPGKHEPAAVFVKKNWSDFLEAWQTLE